ncbi:MAG: hypothetical protein HYR67_04615 [Bacteroidetes bacterium]|nr:hypothetical protein [Bacteroidota bacterium]
MILEKENVYFNRIFIIQSLPDGDKRTGDEIELKIKYISFKESSITVELIDVDSRSSFFNELKKIRELIPNGILPFIHFEIHGNEHGLVLSNNELLEWNDLKEPLRDLNKRTKNNLFISLATCYGGYLLRIYKPWEACPFYGYIGPIGIAFDNDLEASYSAFFETLLLTNDFANATEKLQETVEGNSKLYISMNCSQYFNNLVAQYKEENKNPRIQNERVKQIVKNLKKEYSNRGVSNKKIKREADRFFLTNKEDEEIEKMSKIFFHKE